MLTVLVSTILNSQVSLLKKCECKSYSHFFSEKMLAFFQRKNVGVYAIFNDQNFNDTLTNNYVSFVQLGPGKKWQTNNLV